MVTSSGDRVEQVNLQDVTAAICGERKTTTHWRGDTDGFMTTQSRYLTPMDAPVSEAERITFRNRTHGPISGRNNYTAGQHVHIQLKH